MATHCGRQPDVALPESLHIRTAEQRMGEKGLARRRSVPKITGRKLRTPRKFVVTDVTEDEDLALNDAPQLQMEPTPASSADESAALPQLQQQGEQSSEVGSETPTAAQRKGKTQVKGRFTIIDLSPESPEPSSKCPEREDMSASVGPSRRLETPRRRTGRKMTSRRPFQSTGDVRAAAGLMQRQQQQQFQQQATCPTEDNLFASFRRPGESPSSRTTVTLPRRVSLNALDHHLEFLNKESADMKSVLESMVATNAQWIEALASVGLHGQNAPSGMSTRVSDVSLSDAMVPVETCGPSLEQKYREMEQAYAELQTKYEAECQKSERAEVKNAMLEIRLQQQINRSEMLRSQLDKLTKYTENLIGESSEPTINDYNSDSVFDEDPASPKEEPSPSVDEVPRTSEFPFNYDVVKTRRSRHSVDEECISDTSTEGESLRKMSSPSPFERAEDNNQRYFSDLELSSADLTSSSEMLGHPQREMSLDSLLDDQANQLRQSLRSSIVSEEGHASVIDSLDSLAVCPSASPFTLEDVDSDVERTDDNQVDHSEPVKSDVLDPKRKLLRHSSSLASINYSTVSSSSSLASYGLQLAAIAQSKVGLYTGMATSSLFGNGSNQHSAAREEKMYTELSPESLRFHDTQSLLQAAEESAAAKKPTTRLGFPFTSLQLHPASIPASGPNEDPERTTGSSGLSGSGLYQRFACARRR